jgi:hypothetical protein
LAYLLYLNTKDVKLLKRAFNTGVNKNNASLSSIKEENNSKDESVLEFSPKKKPKSSNEDEEYSAFEEEKKLEQSVDTPAPYVMKTEKSVKVEQSEDPYESHNEKDIKNKSEDLDKNKSEDLDKNPEEMDEHQILNLAESVFARIGQEMLRRNLTTSLLFKDETRTIKNENKPIDVIDNSTFITGLKALGIMDLKADELKATLKLLSKDSMDNMILIKDLIDVLVNFGVIEYDPANADNSVGYTETDDPRRRRKKPLNFDSLNKESLNILAVFTDYLLDTDTSVYEFFDGLIFNQIVRTKNKQNSVEIMAANDFFTIVRE